MRTPENRKDTKESKEAKESKDTKESILSYGGSFSLLVRSEPWAKVPAIVRLRTLLKRLKREHGFQCVRLVPVTGPDEIEQSGIKEDVMNRRKVLQGKGYRTEALFHTAYLAQTTKSRDAHKVESPSLNNL